MVPESGRQSDSISYIFPDILPPEDGFQRFPATSAVVQFFSVQACRQRSCISQLCLQCQGNPGHASSFFIFSQLLPRWQCLVIFIFWIACASSFALSYTLMISLKYVLILNYVCQCHSLPCPGTPAAALLHTKRWQPNWKD